ncbi:MAG TPA: DUF2207 domain-containing protein, partial [Ilumatobacter sp.]|nr:DUF2207 domain-containing protein [Ilumatobacter sp.]
MTFHVANRIGRERSAAAAPSVTGRVGSLAVNARRVLALVGVSAVATVSLFASTANSGSFEEIHRQDIEIVIEESGDLLISETIEYDFGTFPKHGILRNIPVRFDYPKKKDTDRVYPLDVISVDGSADTPDQYQVLDYTENGVGYKQLKIGDPDTTITGAHTYEL